MYRLTDVANCNRRAKRGFGFEMSVNLWLADFSRWYILPSVQIGSGGESHQGGLGDFPQQARKCMYMELAKCIYTYTACEVLVGKAKAKKNEA